MESGHLSVGVPLPHRYCHRPLPTPHQSSPQKHPGENLQPQKGCSPGPTHLACPKPLAGARPPLAFRACLPRRASGQLLGPPQTDCPSGVSRLILLARIPTRPPRAPRLSVGGGGGTGTAPPAHQASPETATIGTRTIGPSKGRRRRRMRRRRRRRRPVTSSC